MESKKILAAQLLLTPEERDAVLMKLDEEGFHSYVGLGTLAEALVKLWATGKIAQNLDTVDVLEHLCPNERWFRATHVRAQHLEEKRQKEAKLKSEGL